jgi:hypothetical protein
MAPRKVRLSLRALASLLAAATGALSLMAGCRGRPPAATSPTAQAPTAQAAFVGNAACAGCHPAEYKNQSHSRHMQTLHRMSRQDLGALAPPSGEFGRSGYVIQERGDQFVFARPSQTTAVAPIQYALGSGKTGMTYVSVVGGDKLMEFRFSYFPHPQQWYMTPGQEDLGPDDLAKTHPPADARKCLLCHAVTLPANSPAPDPRFFGVGCESCHGPGSLHVAAMHAGRPQTGMESLAAWPATRLNEMCGQCHGTATEIAAARLPPDSTARYQPYGLMRSRCFLESKKTLSCLTCHDPHTDASTNVETYTAACLTCHSAPTSVDRPSPLWSLAIKTCPVNPKAKCITCHMPPRNVIANSPIPTYMADHYIRIHR